MRKGFTLVELLIVVIIVGILATIAVPQYQKMVNRAKWAECMTLSDSIKTAQSLYYAEYGTYRTGSIADLTNLSLPDGRKFNFSIAVATKIYGYNSTDAQDLVTVPTNNFYINLTSNATGYSGSAPGSY